jgi:hypothetical protein
MDHGLSSRIGLLGQASPAKRTKSLQEPVLLLSGRGGPFDNRKIAWGYSRKRSSLVCFAYWDVGATKSKRLTILSESFFVSTDVLWVSSLVGEVQTTIVHEHSRRDPEAHKMHSKSRGRNL